MTRAAHRHAAIVCMALCTWLCAARAQEPPGAWRCGNSYTDQPCKGGKAVALDEAPSPEQAREAQRDTRRTQAAADRMERDRLRQEKAVPAPLVHLDRPANAIATAEPPQPTGRAKKRAKRGRGDPEFFTAAGPGAAKKKKAPVEAGR